ncbi:MAG: radical SAM protein [Ruminiclostridium sp.]
MTKKRFLIVLWLTGRCNLNCRYCYASENCAKNDMAFETARLVIDKMRGEPLKIQFAGGEPMLNFGLAERVCEYVLAEGIDAVFQMQTNGILIDKPSAKRIKRLNISVGVSLDGVPEINELTRGKSGAAIDGIRCLAEENIIIGINSVVTSKNVNRLYELADLALYLGNVGGIGLDLLRKAGNALNNYNGLRPDPEQIRNALIKLAERAAYIYDISGKKIEIREIEKAGRLLRTAENKYGYCYASCGRSLVVLPDGSLYPCGSLLNKKYCMGSAAAFEAKAITPVKCGKTDKCSDCRFEKFCTGGCPSRRIRNEDELDCVLMKTAFELAERNYCADLN